MTSDNDNTCECSSGLIGCGPCRGTGAMGGGYGALCGYCQGDGAHECPDHYVPYVRPEPEPAELPDDINF